MLVVPLLHERVLPSPVPPLLCPADNDRMPALACAVAVGSYAQAGIPRRVADDNKEPRLAFNTRFDADGRGSSASRALCHP